MEIRTESDITPVVAAKLREAAKMTQREFWEEVGSTQASGHLFEAKKRKNGIPRPIRMLIFLRHVVGIPIRVSTPEDADMLIKSTAGVGKKFDVLRAEADAKAAQLRAEEEARKAKLRANELAKEAQRVAG